MSREQRLAALFARTHAGIKPGLGLMRELLEELGNPQERFLSVHVAGTNGKGSVCAMTEALLRSRGIRTGMYTSPHVERVNERIRMGEGDIEDERLFGVLDRIEAVEGRLSRLPTFFEVLTAAGFLAFAEEGVQVAVLETGMGGRLDATNVVTPLVGVITRIDLDHTAYLGGTLGAVAGEKAGIIKEGRPVVFTEQHPEAAGVLRAAAERMGARVLESGELVSLSGREQDLSGQRFVVSTASAEYGRVGVPLVGRFQAEALAAALCAAEEVCRVLGVELEPVEVRRALGKLRWRARCEVVDRDPPVVMDAAHNPAGAAALALTLEELFGKRVRGAFVVGQMRDKDHAGFFGALAGVMGRCLCVHAGGERGMPSAELAAAARRAGISAEAVSVEEARGRLPELAREWGFGCIAGSIYLAGAWEAVGADPGESSER